MNLERSFQLINELAKRGVAEFCLCPGARNAPLIKTFGSQKNLMTHSFFDERSAAFFALGRIKKTGRPVAVVTTSGTAVAELLPAVVEAHYSRLPLVVISADRPPCFRHSGAPQTIQQIGLFSHFVETVFDLNTNSELNLEKEITRPLHVNICFDEPLLSGKMVTEQAGVVDCCPLSSEPNSLELEQLAGFFSVNFRSLVVLGAITDRLAEWCEILKFLNYPIVAESHSNLGGYSDLEHLMLKCSEGYFKTESNVTDFDSVIRIGGVPTVRFWRDLESKYSHLPVLSVSNTPYSGLGREQNKPVQPAAFIKYAKEIKFKKFSQLPDIMIKNKEFAKEITSLICQYPCSEVNLLAEVSKKISEGDQVFLGNSLVIREWDMVAVVKKGQKIFSNRGVNGIDGLVSTAIATAIDHKGSTWCVLGDLSALYDLSGLWPLQSGKIKGFKVVVVNNGGGKIFSSLFSDPAFENRHQVNLKGWAQMFAINYYSLESLDNWPKINQDENCIVEVFPNNIESEKFWSEYRSLWQNA